MWRICWACCGSSAPFRAKGVRGNDHSASWNCYPANAGWTTLKSTIEGAFARAEGDFNAGQRTFGMLRQAGLEDVQLRAAIIGLQDQHPYKRVFVQLAASLRGRILEGGLLSEPELDAAVAECERVAADPRTIVISMVVTQIWGRKPIIQGER